VSRGSAGLRRFTSPAPGAAPPAGAAPAATATGTATATAATSTAGTSTAATSTAGTATAGTATAGTAERCALCAAAVGDGHGHVADVEQSVLLCACRACYLLFTSPQAGGGRYRAVPDRYLSDPARPLSPADWERLQIPVGLAFFLRSSRLGTVTAFYPSPAGATECTLDVLAWAELAQARPLLGTAAPDVEAILVARAETGIECYCVPVDACYELAGRMRQLWRGFDGGAEARASIASFLDDVRRRARPLADQA